MPRPAVQPRTPRSTGGSVRAGGGSFHGFPSVAAVKPKRLAWRRRLPGSSALLDVMDHHLGRDVEHLAAGHAEVLNAMCLATELARMEPAESAEIQRVSAVATQSYELLEAGQELGGDLAFGKGVVRVQPADGAHMIAGGDHRFVTHVGEEAHSSALSRRRT